MKPPVWRAPGAQMGVETMVERIAFITQPYFNACYGTPEYGAMRHKWREFIEALDATRARALAELERIDFSPAAPEKLARRRVFTAEQRKLRSSASGSVSR